MAGQQNIIEFLLAVNTAQANAAISGFSKKIQNELSSFRSQSTVFHSEKFLNPANLHEFRRNLMTLRKDLDTAGTTGMLSGRKLAESFKTGNISLRAFSTNISSLEGQFRKSAIRVNYGQQIEGLGRSMVRLGKDTQWLGRQLTVGLTAPLAAFATQTTRAFMSINTEYTRLKKVIGEETWDANAVQEWGNTTFTILEQATARGNNLREAINFTPKEGSSIGTTLENLGTTLSNTYGVSQRQIAEIMADWAAMGYAAQDLGDIVTQVLKINVIGDFGSNMEGASNLIRSTMAIWTGEMSTVQEKITETNDLMAQASAIEAGTSLWLQDLATSLPEVANSAKLFNLSFSETLALLAGAKQRGIESSEAAHGLKFILQRITNPTEKASEAFVKYTGKSLDQLLNENQTGMERFLALSRELLALEEKDPRGAATLVGDIGGLRQADRFLSFLKSVKIGMQELKQNGNDATQMTSDFAKAIAAAGSESLGIAGMGADALRELANTKLRVTLESPEMQFKKAKETFTNLMADIGKTILPVFLKGFKILNFLLEVLTKLPGPIKSILIFLGVLIASVGPVVLTFGLLKTVLGFNIGMIGKLIRSFANFRLNKIAEEIFKVKNVFSIFHGDIAGSPKFLEKLGMTSKSVFDNMAGSILKNIELQEQLLALLAKTPIVPSGNQQLSPRQAAANLTAQIFGRNAPGMPGTYSSNPTLLPTNFIRPPSNVGNLTQSGFTKLANAQAVFNNNLNQPWKADNASAKLKENIVDIKQAVNETKKWIDSTIKLAQEAKLKKEATKEELQLIGSIIGETKAKLSADERQLTLLEQQALMYQQQFANAKAVRQIDKLQTSAIRVPRGLEGVVTRRQGVEAQGDKINARSLTALDSQIAKAQGLIDKRKQELDAAQQLIQSSAREGELTKQQKKNLGEALGVQIGRLKAQQQALDIEKQHLIVLQEKKAYQSSPEGRAAIKKADNQKQVFMDLAMKLQAQYVAMQKMADAHTFMMTGQTAGIRGLVEDAKNKSWLLIQRALLAIEQNNKAGPAARALASALQKPSIAFGLNSLIDVQRTVAQIGMTMLGSIQAYWPEAARRTALEETIKKQLMVQQSLLAQQKLSIDGYVPKQLEVVRHTLEIANNEQIISDKLRQILTFYGFSNAAIIEMINLEKLRVGLLGEIFGLSSAIIFNHQQIAIAQVVYNNLQQFQLGLVEQTALMWGRVKFEVQQTYDLVLRTSNILEKFKSREVVKRPGAEVVPVNRTPAIPIGPSFNPPVPRPFNAPVLRPFNAPAPFISPSGEQSAQTWFGKFRSAIGSLGGMITSTGRRMGSSLVNGIMWPMRKLGSAMSILISETSMKWNMALSALAGSLMMVVHMLPIGEETKKVIMGVLTVMMAFTGVLSALSMIQGIFTANTAAATVAVAAEGTTATLATPPTTAFGIALAFASGGLSLFIPLLVGAAAAILVGIPLIAKLSGHWKEFSAGWKEGTKNFGEHWTRAWKILKPALQYLIDALKKIGAVAKDFFDTMIKTFNSIEGRPVKFVDKTAASIEKAQKNVKELKEEIVDLDQKVSDTKNNLIDLQKNPYFTSGPNKGLPKTTVEGYAKAQVDYLNALADARIARQKLTEEEKKAKPETRAQQIKRLVKEINAERIANQKAAATYKAKYGEDMPAKKLLNLVGPLTQKLQYLNAIREKRADFKAYNDHVDKLRELGLTTVETNRKIEEQNPVAAKAKTGWEALGEGYGKTADKMGFVIEAGAAIIAAIIYTIGWIGRLIAAIVEWWSSMLEGFGLFGILYEYFRTFMALLSGDWSNFWKGLLRSIIITFFQPLFALMDKATQKGGGFASALAGSILNATGLGSLTIGLGLFKKEGDSFQGWLRNWMDTNIALTDEGFMGTGFNFPEFKLPEPSVTEKPSDSKKPGSPTPNPEDSQDFLSALRSKLSDIVQEFKKQILDAFDEAQKKKLEAFEKKQENEKEAFDKKQKAELKVYDDKIKAIEDLNKADEERYANEEYLASRREILENRQLDHTNYLRSRRAAMFAGNIDAVRKLDMDEIKAKKASEKQLTDLDEKRRRELVSKERQAAIDRIKAAKEAREKIQEQQRKEFEQRQKKALEAFQKMQESERNAFQKRVDLITEYTPRTVAELQTMLDRLNGAARSWGMSGGTFANTATLAMNSFKSALNAARQNLIEENKWKAAGQQAGDALGSGLGKGITDQIDNTWAGIQRYMKFVTARTRAALLGIDAEIITDPKTGNPALVIHGSIFDMTYTNAQAALDYLDVLEAWKPPQRRALGGLIDNPEIAMIGEAGPELVLPLNNPSRMGQIIKQAQSKGLMKKMMFNSPGSGGVGIPESTTNAAGCSTTIQETNIYVDNFIGEKQWFESMMNEYNIRVRPSDQAAKGRVTRKISSYKDNLSRYH